MNRHAAGTGMFILVADWGYRVSLPPQSQWGVQALACLSEQHLGRRYSILLPTRLLVYAWKWVAKSNPSILRRSLSSQNKVLFCSVTLRTHRPIEGTLVFFEGCALFAESLYTVCDLGASRARSLDECGADMTAWG
jgi:hypothetical protein